MRSGLRRRRARRLRKAAIWKCKIGSSAILLIDAAQVAGEFEILYIEFKHCDVFPMGRHDASGLVLAKSLAETNRQFGGKTMMQSLFDC
jgi:hypothetical protein